MQGSGKHALGRGQDNSFRRMDGISQHQIGNRREGKTRKNREEEMGTGMECDK